MLRYPWETYERQPCELLEYTRGQRCTCLLLLCRRANQPGNSQRVGLYHRARGTLFFWKTPKFWGNRGESEHSLGRTLPMAIFPKTAHHRKNFCLLLATALVLDFFY